MIYKDQILQSFYRQHKDFLQQNYPGIHLRSLSQKLSKVSVERLFQILKFILQGRPFEYILQESYFYGNAFYTDERVLIPRSETEILVERALVEIKNLDQKEIQLIDIGTGSGCIGLSILCQYNGQASLKLVCSDLSLEALEVSRINFFRLSYHIHPRHQVQFVQRDRLDGEHQKFDFILTNPPYIKESFHRHLVHSNVDHFEPHQALYLPDDKYREWFCVFFEQISSHLRQGGQCLMEGHEEELLELKKIGQEYFKTIDIIQDYNQRDRFLHCK